MTRAIFSILLAVSTVACHASPPQEPNSAATSAADRWREKVIAAKNHVLALGQPRKVTRGAKPEIVLRKGQITYNGTPLALDTDLNAWRQVLGPETACDGDYRKYEVHCWNNLGIWVGTSRKRGGRVASLYVFFNQKPNPFGDYGPGISPVDGKPNSPGLDFSHNHLFKGYLELDGAGVDAQSKVWEITDLAAGDYTYHCIRELRDCGIGPADRKYSMGFNTDGDLEEGRIYNLEISLLGLSDY